MISVIIPARNEFLLGRTIDSILESAEGEIEVIAILDGYWPEPIKDDPRVTLIHHTNPIGQRAAVNEAVRIAKGKYILKTDAHSMFDKGFDVKLAEDCEYDWTVIPRMYNLHAFDWVCENGHRFYQDKFKPEGGKCKDCGKSVKIEWVWKPRLHKKTDFMYMDKNLKVQYWYKYAKRKESKGDIVDIMNGVGACWFQHRERFLELGGLDENHGSWGQVGVEVGCKAWLSGGRHIVNRKTWFAHLFRTTKEFTFPYKVKVREQDKAKAYSRDLWLNDKWPLAKRPFQWLLEKFQPIPTWDVIKRHASIDSYDPGPSITVSPNMEDEPLLSVIIPARNEMYLQKTIDDCLAKLTTDFEIVVGLDGYKPELKKDPRVVLCHSERIGMRPMINKMAKMAKGEYLMKLDAHCILDEGVDKKLIECCGSKDVTIALRYELKSKDWTRRERTDCPYRYLSHPDSDPKGKALRGLAWPEYATQHKDEDIGETMTITGSIWMMERKRFFEIGGLDEKHGTFGQEGAELSCKIWLSGGRVLVNKKTWYAHWNRGQAPYALAHSQKDKSYERSRELWMGDNWPLATRKFQWLIDKFSPVHGWNDLTLLYYTDNSLPEEFAEPIRSHLKEVAGNYPIISISQNPMDFGQNICVGNIGRSYRSILKQILVGAKATQTPYVALCEHDNLYPKEHFDLRPVKGDVVYNQNRTRLLCDVKMLRADCGGKSMSLCIAKRDVLIKDIEQKLPLLGINDESYRKVFEPGKNPELLDVPEVKVDFGKSDKPVLSICNHDGNFGGRSHVKDKWIKSDTHWGTYKELNKRFYIDALLNGHKKPEQVYHYRYGYRSRSYKVDKLYDNFVNFADPNKRDPDNPRGVYEFHKTFRPFVDGVLAGKEYTDEELKQLPYYGYLAKHIKKLPDYTDLKLDDKGVRHVLKKMRRAESLCKDIRDNGLQSPLCFWKNGKQRILQRGQRRVVIMKKLGIRKALAFVFDDKKSYDKKVGRLTASSGGRVEKAAKRLYAKYGRRSSDKYYKHNYPHYYDRHITRTPKKILEIGIKKGASLLLWKKAFPKSRIYGVDIRDVSQVEIIQKNKDFKIFHGDATDSNFLKKISKDGKFDLIIDDGSHDPFDVKTTLRGLWPSVKKGGWYVIEDLWHEGRWFRDGAHYFSESRSIIMDELKNMIAKICFGEEVESICFYPNICFIQKNG